MSVNICYGCEVYGSQVEVESSDWSDPSAEVIGLRRRTCVGAFRGRPILALRQAIREHLAEVGCDPREANEIVEYYYVDADGPEDADAREQLARGAYTLL